MSMAMLLNAATVVSSSEQTPRRGRIPITSLLSSDPASSCASSEIQLTTNPTSYSDSKNHFNVADSPSPVSYSQLSLQCPASTSHQDQKQANQQLPSLPYPFSVPIPHQPRLPLPTHTQLSPPELSDLTSSLTSSLRPTSSLISQSQLPKRFRHQSPPSPCSDESSASDSVRPTTSAPRRRWKPLEDSLLITVVRQHGPGRWNRLAEQFPGRNGRQVRLRWVNHLQPSLDKREWRKEEDDILLKAHRTLGNKWSLIATQLNGISGGWTRTDNSVKNRYKSLIRRSQREHRANGEARSARGLGGNR